MITDALMILEEDMGMPNATETAATNILDMQAAGVAGSGKLFVVGIVTKSATLSTSVAMAVYADDTDGATTKIFTGEVILTAAATKGKVLGCFALPPDVGRYIGASLITAGAGANAGTATLFVTNHPVKSN